MTITDVRPRADKHFTRTRRMWRSPRAFWASLAFIVVVIVVGLVVGLTGGSTTPVTTVTTAPAGPAPTDHDMTIPISAPAVSWVQWQGMALPESGTTYGPSQHLGPDAVAGFARTPRGSLLGIINATARSIFATDAGWPVVFASELAPGKGRDVLTGLRAAAHGSAGASDPNQMQVAGFHFIYWSPDLATISLATSQPSTGQLQAVTLTAIWQNNDWKLALQDTGAQSTTGGRIDTLDGYVIFVPGDGAHT
jgi:hypothetical protein